MPEIPNIAFAMNLPPEKAIEYFRSKGYTFSFRWRDTWREAHAKVFTVAGAMRQDILSSIRGELVTALEEGRTFRQFQQELEPTLKKLGWWGNIEIMDPVTGELREIDVTPWRLRNIYRTNMQTSYMAGRYKQQVDMKDSRPYWMYVAVMDESTRATHAARNETVYHADDPIWDWLYPPNDWGCRCRVRALSERRMKSLGLEVQDGAKAQKFAGEGWDYNPGKAAKWDDIDPTSPGAPSPVPAMAPGAGRTESQSDWRSFNRPDIRDIPDELRLTAERLPAANSLEEALEKVAGVFGVSAEKPQRFIETPAGRVLIDYDKLLHTVEKRQDMRERFAEFALKTLEDPFEIWNTRFSDGKYRKQYIGLFTGKYNVLVSVIEALDGSLLWNYFHANDKSMNKNRRGDALLYAK